MAHSYNEILCNIKKKKNSKGQSGNKVKHTQIGKEEINLSLSIDDMILCTENPNEFTKIIIRTNKSSSVNKWDLNW